MEKTQNEITINMTDVDLKSPQNGLNISKTSEYSLHFNDKNGKEIILSQNNDSEITTASDTSVKPNIYKQIRSETPKFYPHEVEAVTSSPDILSTLQKTTPSTLKTTSYDASRNDKQSEFSVFDKTSLPSDKFSKSKIFLTQTSYISPSRYSDSSTEAELNCLSNLKSLKTDQSIYKLAYDESITDQSEADSRSPSPIDPESQVPKSIINDEIIIHEADSCSDAGSEDVELIPHRYESETFLNESKHMYVNKLSLAVELLRTKENLPYDEQFKRVSEENDLNLQETYPDATGEVNLGFEDDSSLFDDLKSRSDNPTFGMSHNVVTRESEVRSESRNSAAVCSFLVDDSFNESCEEAREEVLDVSNARNNSEGVRVGYRRLQVQFRHYFTPRAVLGNPCLCCIIM